VATNKVMQTQIDPERKLQGRVTPNESTMQVQQVNIVLPYL
jgi:hypothetical protein